MDLGIMAIEPTSLRILSNTQRDANWRDTLLVKDRHGLNPVYLQYHLSRIYMEPSTLGEAAIMEEYPSF